MKSSLTNIDLIETPLVSIRFTDIPSFVMYLATIAWISSKILTILKTDGQTDSQGQVAIATEIGIETKQDNNEVTPNEEGSRPLCLGILFYFVSHYNLFH